MKNVQTGWQLRHRLSLRMGANRSGLHRAAAHLHRVIVKGELFQFGERGEGGEIHDLVVGDIQGFEVC